MTSPPRGWEKTHQKTPGFQVAMKIQTPVKFHILKKWSFGSFFPFQTMWFLGSILNFPRCRLRFPSPKTVSDVIPCDKAKSWPPGVGRCLAAWPSLPRAPALGGERPLFRGRSSELWILSWKSLMNIWPKKLSDDGQVIKKHLRTIMIEILICFELSLELWSNLCLRFPV